MIHLASLEELNKWGYGGADKTMLLVRLICITI